MENQFANVQHHVGDVYVADMHCRSDEYLADELLLELQGKK